MALLGSAALAIWCDVAPQWRGEFEDWHSHEHFPERLRIAGFRRASRWTSVDSGEGFFILYELADYQTLISPPYLERLNDPTPWSRKMMPHHRNMVRSQCRVTESFGGLSAGFLATLRLSPVPGMDETLRVAIRRKLAGQFFSPGLGGGHLLRTDTPAIAQTTEQKIRGGADDVADWIVVATGYDLALLHAAMSGMSDPQNLEAAKPERVLSFFRLAHTMTPDDLINRGQS